MTISATDISHGHLSVGSKPRTPRTATDNPQFDTTDKSTDTTDTLDHGHDCPLYRGAVSPVAGPETCPKCGSDRVMRGAFYARGQRACLECGHRWDS